MFGFNSCSEEKRIKELEVKLEVLARVYSKEIERLKLENEAFKVFIVQQLEQSNVQNEKTAQLERQLNEQAEQMRIEREFAVTIEHSSS